MEMKNALAALGALAHDTRLRAFRTLVQAGPTGLGAGDLAARLDVPPPTLSFHLRDLDDAGLVVATREGRTIRYAADFEAMTALMGFLTENCCAGRPELCAPVACAPPPVSRPSPRKGASP
jgi:ArsR family transcriptional regulator, arsenate/arsenite/antimonite-responsive transcriptional repressor